METTTTSDDRERLRQLASALDCFTEEDHLLMSGCSAETAKSWRKRGEGPPYILHGKNYFYPRKPYAKYLQGKVHERKGFTAESLL